MKLIRKRITELFFEPDGKDDAALAADMDEELDDLDDEEGDEAEGDEAADLDDEEDTDEDDEEDESPKARTSKKKSARN